MDNDIFQVLEQRVEDLLDRYLSLQREILDLREENGKLLQERNDLRVRIDGVLKKLEGI
jgi:cell division protein ZapB